MKLSAIQLPKKESRAQELYKYLRQAILDGNLEPGDRLVEEQIAGIASVSRTPVREALRKLEADGLVQAAPRGAIVTSPTLEEVVDLCVVRETLEGLAARLASISCSEMELAAMRRLLEECEEISAVADLPRLVQLNNSFHETIWQAGRNRHLVQQLRILRTLIQRMQTTTLAIPDRRQEASKEHRAIVDAIERRDGDAADELSKTHVRNAIAIRAARLKM